MSATIPMPLLGRHLTSVVITGQTVSSAGVLSDGTSIIVAAAPPNAQNVFRTGQFSSEPEAVEVNAANTSQRNEIVVSDGMSLTLEIFKVNNGNDPDPLMALHLAYDVFKVVWVEGTVIGSVQTCTFYGRRGNLTTGIQGRGEQIAEAQFGPVDPGAPTVAQFSRVLS